MQGFLIALRTIHYTACIGLFGAFLFHLVIALPALRAAQTRRSDHDPHRRLTSIGLVWFGNFPDAWTFAGGAIIAASGLYVIHRERLHKVGEVAEPSG